MSASRFAIGCPECGARALGRGSVARRLSVVVGAGVVGMLLGAVVAGVLGAAIGLEASLTIMLMLVFEVALGGIAAVVTDRAVTRLRAERDRAALEGHIPEARLLPGKRE